MWIRDREHLHLHSLEWHDSECVYMLTDLTNVYAERLSFAEIEKRGEELSLQLALSTQQQISVFLGVLQDQLKADRGMSFREDSVGKELSVTFDLSHSGIEDKWNFKLHSLSVSESKVTFAKFIADLYATIGNLGEKLEAYEKIIREKNLLLAGFQEAAERQVEYHPPKQLERAFRHVEDLEVEDKEATKLAASNWPKKFQLVLKPPARTYSDAMETEETELDSDVTYDSGFATSPDA